jgi:hypothetical protein
MIAQASLKYDKVLLGDLDVFLIASVPSKRLRLNRANPNGNFNPRRV